jgi:hypothetical protein
VLIDCLFIIALKEFVLVIHGIIVFIRHVVASGGGLPQRRSEVLIVPTIQVGLCERVVSAFSRATLAMAIIWL